MNKERLMIKGILHLYTILRIYYNRLSFKLGIIYYIILYI